MRLESVAISTEQINVRPDAKSKNETFCLNKIGSGYRGCNSPRT